jgi:hypothetical protein
MSNDESMTKYECCSLRCPQRNLPDTRYPLGGSGHYSHSVIRHSSDFLLVNLRGSD